MTKQHAAAPSTVRSPDYDVTILGFNYRMDELRAAVWPSAAEEIAGME